MKPYYSDDAVTIYHGRWEDVLPTLTDGSVDLTVTSPPYNMGLVPGGNGRGMYRPGASNKAGRFREGYDGDNDDAMPIDQYCAWQRAALAEMWRVTSGAIFYNHRPRVIHGQWHAPLYFNFGGLVPTNVIYWDRGTGIDVTLTNFCTVAEWILLFAKPDFRLASHAASGMGNVWRLGMATDDFGHPAPFPLSLPTKAITASADVAVVLDPFMGTGTTLRAAKDCGVRAIGCDKSEDFCEIAAKRMAQEVLDLGGAA